MEIEIKDIKQVQEQLNDLSEKIDGLNGDHQILFSQLLSPLFLKDCSKFASVDELFKASGFNIESSEDFRAIPDNKWDAFIKENTCYGDWSEMFQAASAAWVKEKLNL